MKLQFADSDTPDGTMMGRKCLRNLGELLQMPRVHIILPSVLAAVFAAQAKLPVPQHKERDLFDISHKVVNSRGLDEYACALARAVRSGRTSDVGERPGRRVRRDHHDSA